MNWDQMKGQWKQVQGQARQKWADLTDDDMAQIEGKREELVGRIQQRYGVAKEDAERQADEFAASLNVIDQKDVLTCLAHVTSLFLLLLGHPSPRHVAA